ncbi:hypothetical protein BKA62DRAFT_773383 [Auriculariales sp. MPI-PUGE-AT-0066]|nr:hypothetical protein BKA62DRAFT_773383 [Auriculariales sp. MPI-PUGE-AT-0066]
MTTRTQWPEDSSDDSDNENRRDRVLPGPVTLSRESSARRGTGNVVRRPLVRIAGPSLRVHWAKLKQKFGTASAPSESAMEGSTTEASSRGHAMIVQSGMVTEHADKEAVGVESVDVVVVDRDFHLNGTETAPSTVDKSEKSSQQHPHLHTHLNRHPLPTHVGGGLVPRPAIESVRHFFDMGSELQPQVERQYRKEQWHLSKRIALMSSLFYVLNWPSQSHSSLAPHHARLLLLLRHHPYPHLPAPLPRGLEPSRDNGWFYQFFLAASTWVWATYVTIYINICGYYGTHAYVSCNGKDFIGIVRVSMQYIISFYSFYSQFYFTTALPTIASSRSAKTASPPSPPASPTSSSSPSASYPTSLFSRQAVNFIIYQMFLLYIHFKKEGSDRRLYHMREELKNQYRATQKAQVAERKASDSKRRLTSYIFHEVRVPLNTALLATQNMEASGTVPIESEIEFRALQGSLSMMSKGPNRMDAGRFESVSRPFALHTALRSMFAPMKLAAEAKGLQAVLELDARVDIVARLAMTGAYPQLDVEDGAGVVIGDEMRLRQIINNLTSNATKFTPSGGSIKIVTHLIHPAPGEPLPSSPISSGRIIVRIEVHDTGVGIRARELADGGRRLFSPYVQTEIGRVQGGKGSGLGLALVRHIVRLSHGRLGVRSRVGANGVGGSGSGTVFWIELSFGVGPEAMLVPPGGGLGLGVDASEGGRTMSRGGSDAGNLLTAAVRKATDPANAMMSSGVAEFERSMLARRPDPGFSAEPQPGMAPALLRPTTRRSISRRPPLEHGATGSSFPSTIMSGDTPGSEESAATAPPSPIDRPSLPRRSSSGKAPRSKMMQSMMIPPPSTIEPPPLHDLTPTALGSLGMTTYFPNVTPPHSPHPPPPTTMARRMSSPPTPGSMSSAAPPSPTGLATPPPGLTIPTSVNHVQTGPPSPTTTSRFGLSHAGPGPVSSPTSMTGVGLGVASRSAGSLTSTGAAAVPAMKEDRRMRVLVVDDDGLTRRLMGRMLARLGCVVDTAEHGQQALDMLLLDPSNEGDGPYACTFLDNQMHVMSGLEMIARLREIGRKDFVVGVTGNALLSDQEEYLGAGVDHVLTKPVMEQSLKTMLATAHERRKIAYRRNRPPDERERDTSSAAAAAAAAAAEASSEPASPNHALTDSPTDATAPRP